MFTLETSWTWRNWKQEKPENKLKEARASNLKLQFIFSGIDEINHVSWARSRMLVHNVSTRTVINHNSWLIARTMRIVWPWWTLECGECDGVVFEELAGRWEGVLYGFARAASLSVEVSFVLKRYVRLN